MEPRSSGLTVYEAWSNEDGTTRCFGTLETCKQSIAHDEDVLHHVFSVRASTWEEAIIAYHTILGRPYTPMK